MVLAKRELRLEDIVFTKAKRGTVGLTVVDGASFQRMPGTGVTSVPALAATKSIWPGYIGIKSGERAAIVRIGNIAIKYKGINIREALKCHGSYRRPYRGSPRGGMRLSTAQDELEMTTDANKILVCNGFKTVQEPLGVIKYDVTYMPNFLGFLDSTRRAKRVLAFGAGIVVAADAVALLTGSSFHDIANVTARLSSAYYVGVAAVTSVLYWMYYGAINEQMAASVMKVEGDTRLPELLAAGIIDPIAAYRIFSQFGTSIGAQKRVLQEEGFVWNIGDTHSGNLIAHGRDDIYTSVTDFDVSGKDISQARKQAKMANNQLVKSWYVRGLVDRSTRVERSAPYVQEAVKSFGDGFMRGYKNPDTEGARVPVKRQELDAAFNL